MPTSCACSKINKSVSFSFVSIRFLLLKIKLRNLSTNTLIYLGRRQVQPGHLSGATWVVVRSNLGSRQVQPSVSVVLADLRHKLICENQMEDTKL